MTDWETIGIIGMLMPIDALVVGFVTAWFIRRAIRKMWDQEKKKPKKWWPW